MMAFSNRAFLNRGGTSEENPIISGAAIRARLYKHNSNETIRKCWVTVDGDVFFDVTSLVVTETHQAYVDIVAGTHLSSGASPILNTIHFTTSNDQHAKINVWVVNPPAAMITLDGYNRSGWNRPLIYPRYRTEDEEGEE